MGGRKGKEAKKNPNLLKLCNFNLIKGHMISSSADREKERDKRETERTRATERD